MYELMKDSGYDENQCLSSNSVIQEDLIESDRGSNDTDSSEAACAPRKVVELISPLPRGSNTTSPASSSSSLDSAGDVETGLFNQLSQSASPVSSTWPQSTISPSGCTPAMFVYPILGALLESARNCRLLASRSDPPPGALNYPTSMLTLATHLPPLMQRSSWCIADYNITEKLYKGYASSVYKATCKNSGQVVVLKVYTLAAVCDLYKFQIYREVHLHSRLSHENIVKMHAAFQEGDKIVMVQEFADGADLFTVLQKYGGRLSERLAVQLVLEPFMRVLHYLHSMGILHRDVKPENILFTKNMELKLGDFGLAIDLREEKAVTRAGTLDYMAPEILRCPFKARPDENKDNAQLQYAGGVDSWAVGVLTYELLVGYPPFYDKTREGTENLILHSAPVFPMGVTEEARSFINCALTKSAMHRVVIGDMLKHPWIEGYRSGRSLRHTFGNPVRSCCLASPDHITSAALSAIPTELPAYQQQQISRSSPVVALPNFAYNPFLSEQSCGQISAKVAPASAAQQQQRPPFQHAPFKQQRIGSFPSVSFSLSSILSAMTTEGELNPRLNSALEAEQQHLLSLHPSLDVTALRNSEQQGVSPWRFLAANQSPEGCDAEGLKSVSSINPGVVSGPMHSMQQHQQCHSVLLKSTLAPATAVMLPRQHSLPVAAITSQMTTSPHFPSSLVNDQAPIMQAMVRAMGA